MPHLEGRDVAVLLQAVDLHAADVGDALRERALPREHLDHLDAVEDLRHLRGGALQRNSIPPPPLRTKWTRRVPHPVLIGHARRCSPTSGWRGCCGTRGTRRGGGIRSWGCTRGGGTRVTRGPAGAASGPRSTSPGCARCGRGTGCRACGVASDDDGTLAELRAADPSFQFLQLAGSRLPPRPPHFPQVHRRSRGVRTFRRSMGFRTLGALPCTLLHPQ